MASTTTREIFSVGPRILLRPLDCADDGDWMNMCSKWTRGLLKENHPRIKFADDLSPDDVQVRLLICMGLTDDHIGLSWPEEREDSIIRMAQALRVLYRIPEPREVKWPPGPLKPPHGKPMNPPEDMPGLEVFSVPEFSRYAAALFPDAQRPGLAAREQAYAASAPAPAPAPDPAPAAHPGYQPVRRVPQGRQLRSGDWKNRLRSRRRHARVIH